MNRHEDDETARNLTLNLTVMSSVLSDVVESLELAYLVRYRIIIYGHSCRRSCIFGGYKIL